MPKKPALVAVSDATPGTAGAIVYWRLSGGLDLSRLSDAWDAQGLDRKLLPDEPTPAVALRRAVAVLKKPDTRIEATRAGLVVLDRRETGTEGDLEFTKRLVANVDVVGRIKVSFAADSDEASQVVIAYNQALDTLAGPDVSPWLSSLMRALHAVPLRDTGGVYFVPRFSMTRFEKMLAALRESTDHVIAAIPALDSSEAVSAILDALESEAEGELSSIRRDLEAESLGARALNTRIGVTSAVEVKLSSYENLLGGKLDGLRDRIEKMRAELTVAMTVAEQKEAAS